jgi:hypothetical protein
VLAALISATSPAKAQEEGGDQETRVRAELAFGEGLRLMEAGNCRSATPDIALCQHAIEQFNQAHALFPEGLGALRNKAFVESGLGLYKSALTSFEQLAGFARSHPDPRRREWAALAEAEVARLRPLVPVLTISGVRGSAFQVSLDGGPNLGPERRFDLEVDPGSHRLVVQLDGGILRIIDVDLAASARKSLVIDEPSRPTPPKLPADREIKGGNASRTLAWLTTGLGGAAVVTGLGLGTAAALRHDELCDDQNRCQREGFEGGKNLARASTIVTASGAAVLTGGITWLLLTASREANKSSAAPGLTVSASARGATFTLSGVTW